MLPFCFWSAEFPTLTAFYGGTEPLLYGLQAALRGLSRISRQKGLSYGKSADDAHR
jgi:hypothetical protein